MDGKMMGDVRKQKQDHADKKIYSPKRIATLLAFC